MTRHLLQAAALLLALLLACALCASSAWQSDRGRIPFSIGATELRPIAEAMVSIDGAAANGPSPSPNRGTR